MSPRNLPRQTVALLCALLALAAICAPAQGSALNDILGRPKTTTTTSPATATQPAATTQTTQTTTAASARPKHSTIHKSAKAPSGFVTPKIATTVTQSTTPTAKPGLGLPAGKSSPSAATPLPGGVTTPTTNATTTPSVGIAPNSGAGLPTQHPGQTRQSSHQSTSLSPAAIVAAALAALLILMCGVWGFARWYAYEPHWTLSLRHALGEAGSRMSATWDEFSDWAKLGR